jgi:hypothetical protein
MGVDGQRHAPAALTPERDLVPIVQEVDLIKLWQSDVKINLCVNNFIVLDNLWHFSVLLGF